VALVRMSKEHGLLLDCAGYVYSFGCGTDGQLGHGALQDEILPRRVTDIDEVVTC